MALRPCPFTLTLDERPRIPGETVSGHLELDVRRAWNDNVDAVILKIRGSVETMISKGTHTAGQGRHTVKDRQILIRKEQTLWRRQDTLFPQPPVDAVTIPFTFTLPRGLPPSCRTTSASRHAYAEVQYYVKVVAVRPGRFRRNRRSRSILKVGSAPDLDEEHVRHIHLALPWSERSLERSFHTFSWQSRSTLRVHVRDLPSGVTNIDSEIPQLALPDISALPLGISIPFRLRILIRTCSPDSVAAREEAASQTSFLPIAISDPELLKLSLWRKSTVRAELRGACREVDFSNPIHNAGGLGSLSAESRRVARVRPQPWTVEAGRKPGTLARSRLICIDSTMVFGSLSSFKSDLVEIDYFLRLSIPIKNRIGHLEFDFPISLVKVHDTVPPAYEDEPTLRMEPPPYVSIR